MENFHNFLRPALVGTLGKRVSNTPRPDFRQGREPFRQNGRGGHGPQVPDQVIEAFIAKPDPVDVDDGHGKAGGDKQLSQRGRFDPGMGSCHNPSFGPVRFDETDTKRGKTVAANECTDERSIGPKGPPDQLQSEGQVVDGVQRADRQAQVVARLAEVVAVLLDLSPAGLIREQRSRIQNIDLSRQVANSSRPIRRWTSQEKRTPEPARNIAQPIEAIFKSAIGQKWFEACASGAIAPQRSQSAVE